MDDKQSGGIVIGDVGGDLSLQVGGDIVGGNKTIINNIIQRIAKELTTTPYKFLASYEIEDRDIFYGRDVIIEELAAQVGRHKVLLINGASGAGKSSLVNAGLIPRVADNGYTFVAFREYSDPLAQLEAHFEMTRGASAPQSPPHAANGRESLLQLIRGFGAFPLVIFLDQFERFFVRVAEDKRRAFIAALNHCSEHSEAKDICFVLAFRREFFGQLTTEFEEQIPEFLNEAYRLNLLPLSKAEAREAILRPLDNTKLRIQYDEDFVDNILLAGLAEQTSGGANIDPPHLQIVCNQLFEAARQHLRTRNSALINRALYDELGGAQNILNTYLDQVVEDVAQDPERIAAVHSILKTMIDAGTNTRSFVAMDGFRRALPDVNEAEILRFIEKLLDRRVVEQRAPSYSLSHEHMVGKVKEWFDPRELERRRAEETLNRGMMEWRNSGALLNRVQVERIRKWLPELADEERALLQASEENHHAEERREAARRKLKRISLYGAAAFTLLVIVLAAYSSLVKVEAGRANKLAVSRQWAGQALSDLDVRPSHSLLLALNSISLTRQIGAFTATDSKQLLNHLLNSTGGVPLQHAAPVAAVRLSPDDRWLAAAGAGIVQLWDMRAAAATPKTLSGHDKVNDLAFSPDSRMLATVGDDATLRLWNMTAADPAAGVQVLTGHRAPIVDVAFAPNGRWVATASRDGTVRLWNPAASNPATAKWVLLHDAPVNSLAFSPDGHWLATASSNGSVATVRFWDLLGSNPTDHPILVHISGDVRKVAFSPNSQWLVAGETETYTTELMRVAAPDKPFFLKVGSWVQRVAFSPDGRWLATPGLYNASVWDLSKPDPSSGPLILRGHKSFILDLAFSLDGAWFATGSADHTVQLWNTTDDFTLSAVLRGHEGPVSSLAFSSDGRRLVTGSDDRTVRLWNTSSPAAEPLALRTQDRAAALDLWDLRTMGFPAKPRIFGDKLDPYAGAIFSPDGKWLAVKPSEDLNSVWLWNLSTSSSTKYVVRHGGAIWASPVFTPEGRWLVTAGAENPTIKLWDLKAPDPTSSPKVLGGHRGPVRSLAISADGHRLVSGARDGFALVWDLTAPNPSANPVRLRGGDIRAAAISGDGRYVMTGSWEPDNAARIWDLSLPVPSSGPVKLTFKDRVFDVAFSPDGRWAAAASWDQTTQLLDLTKTGSKPILLQGHTARSLSVAFSPDSRWLATGNEDRTARLWNLASADPSADSVVLDASGKVGNVSFSPDGHWLALNQTEYRSNPFSPDGRWFASAAPDTRLYHPRLEDLIVLACRTAGRNLTANELQKGDVPLDGKICP